MSMDVIRKRVNKLNELLGAPLFMIVSKRDGELHALTHSTTGQQFTAWYPTQFFDFFLRDAIKLIELLFNAARLVAEEEGDGKPN